MTRATVSVDGTSRGMWTVIVSPEARWAEAGGDATPFGRVNSSCVLDPDPTGLVALDFSLQMKVALQSVLDFHDVNPCTPQLIPLERSARLPQAVAMPDADAPAPPVSARVHR